MLSFIITVKQKADENNFHFYALGPPPPIHRPLRLMEMVLLPALRNRINHMFTFSPSLSGILSADTEVFHWNDVGCFYLFIFYSQEICF